jgi:uncharacterized glyoxalase superfamily protein PhnB
LLSLISHPPKVRLKEQKGKTGPLSGTPRSDVDAVMATAAAAGAAIVTPPHETFWGGCAGYFADPDGHLWEVVWNPQFIPSE